MEFKKIQLSDKELFDEYYKKNPQYLSYLSFANLYIWRNFSDVKFANYDGELIVLGKTMNRQIDFFSLPQATEECLKKVMDKLIADYGEKLLILSMSRRQIEILQKLYPDTVKIKENIDNANYVYETEALKTLSGKKLHSKRNHINKFKSLYNWEYVKIDDSIAKECLGIAKDWCDNKNCEQDPVMQAELSACQEALINMKQLGLKGGAIKVDGKIVAFSIGELLNDETALIHIEKADTSYEGGFTIINNEFICNEFPNVKYINREEDMGIEGLRKAKRSYNPIFLMETFDVRISEK